MTDCPFCRIPADRTHEIVAQNSLCYLVANPEGNLHHGYMVIPFRHVCSPTELSVEEWAAIQPLMLHAKSMLDPFQPDGFNLGWNVGEAGGQHVPHVHMHVLARFADEPLAGKGIRAWLKGDENRRPAS